MPVELGQLGLWGMVGGAAVLVIWGGYQAWQKLKPTMRAERKEQERLRLRDQRRLVRSGEWGDMSTLRHHEDIIDRLQHDAEVHALDGKTIGTKPLPPELAMGIRAYASEGESKPKPPPEVEE